MNDTQPVTASQVFAWTVVDDLPVRVEVKTCPKCGAVTFPQTEALHESWHKRNGRGE